MGLPRMSRRLNERAGARALPRLPNRRVGRVGGRMRGGRHGKGVRAGGGIAQVAGDVIRLPRASQNVLEAGGARPAPPPPASLPCVPLRCGEGPRTGREKGPEPGCGAAAALSPLSPRLRFVAAAAGLCPSGPGRVNGGGRLPAGRLCR